MARASSTRGTRRAISTTAPCTTTPSATTSQPLEKVHTPGIKDKNPARRNFSERAAINAPIQGSAADIIRRAMIRMPKALAAAVSAAWTGDAAGSTRCVVCTGGEPLLRPDFAEIYLYARRLGLKVVLFTNARPITPELADLLAQRHRRCGHGRAGPRHRREHDHLQRCQWSSAPSVAGQRTGPPGQDLDQL